MLGPGPDQPPARGSRAAGTVSLSARHPRTRCTAGRPAQHGPARCARLRWKLHPPGRAVLTHLACHARADALPQHLRTCRCRERGCAWHPRPWGCGGPVLLALTRDGRGRTWRLADTCAASAAATSHTAVVPDTWLSPPGLRLTANSPSPDDSGAASARRAGTRAGDAHLPGVGTPRFASPAARLLALQCAPHCAPTPAAMSGSPRDCCAACACSDARNCGRNWCRTGGWRCPSCGRCRCWYGCSTMQYWTRNVAAARATAPLTGHFCTPLALPAGAPSALRMAVLVLAVHSCEPAGHGADMEALSPPVRAFPRIRWSTSWTSWWPSARWPPGVPTGRPTKCSGT